MSPNDAAARVYDIVYGPYINEQKTAREREFYLARIGPGKILDVGCGTGRHLIPLALAGRDVTGLDNSAGMLAVLHEKYPAAKTVRGDVRTVQLEGGFAGVLCVWNAVSEMALDAEQAHTLFTRVRSWLVPGGTFIFDMYNPGTFDPVEPFVDTITRDGLTYETTYRRIAYDEKTLVGTSLEHIRVLKDGTLVQDIRSHIVQRWWTKDELETFLAKAGFTDVQVYGADFGPYQPKTEQMYFVCRYLAAHK